MTSIKLFISQGTLKTSFRMQVSTSNTFPLVLFKVLTPAQHQSKMKCQNTFITFLSKKPIDSGNLNQLCHEDEYLSTENRKWRNSSALSVTKDTAEVLSFWEDNSTFDAFSTDLSGQMVTRQICLLEPHIAGHILQSSYRTKMTHTKHGFFSSMFHSDFKYS